METKKCKICGKDLPLEKFASYKLKDGRIGYSHQCKNCTVIKFKLKHSRRVLDDSMPMKRIVQNATTEILLNEILERGYKIEKA